MLFFSGTAVIFLSGLCCWFTRTFGKVHITQILWHIEKADTIKGFDEIVIIDLIKWLCICSALCVCWFSAVYGSAVFSCLCGRKAVNRTLFYGLVCCLQVCFWAMTYLINFRCMIW